MHATDTKEQRAWGDIDDEVVRSALHELDRRLKQTFGPRYVKLILFGSRARRDHKPDSDADVAVVMRDRVEKWWPLTQEVLAETYEILLDTGLYIEPWLFEENVLEQPELASNPLLIRAILRDGMSP